MTEKTYPVRVRVLTDSFMGEGPAGHLVKAGTEAIILVGKYEKDVTADDGDLIHKAGDYQLGTNVEFISDAAEGSAAEVLPVGLPNGAVPSGKPGIWLVPVGNGLVYEAWQPGDPSTGLIGATRDDFALNRGEVGPLAEAARDNEAAGILDTGEPQALTETRQTKAQLAARLDAKGISYETDDNRDRLQYLVDENKA